VARGLDFLTSASYLGRRKLTLNLSGAHWKIYSSSGMQNPIRTLISDGRTRTCFRRTPTAARLRDGAA
jgi:hypothetical protein